MNHTKLMTNIQTPLYQFIENESKTHKKTKREIIEESLKLYIKQKKKAKIAKEYELMAQDDEYLNESVELAENGMEYFLTDIQDAD